MPTLSISNLSIAFRGHNGIKQVVSDMSFQMKSSEITALVGESGSGKTLTGLSMMQLLPASALVSESASILYDGEDLLSKTPQQMQVIRGGRIAMVFQEALAAFNPILTIGAQMAEVLALHKFLTGREAKKQGVALLREVGLKDVERVWSAFPHQLSGGMRQRAMVAMALAGDPEFLIADEPTSAIDVSLQKQMMILFKRLVKERGLGILMITHDLPLVQSYADHVLVMMRGKLVEEGRSELFFASPKTAYAKTLLAASMPKRKTKSALEKKLLLRADKLAVHFPLKQGLLGKNRGVVRAVDFVDFQVWRGETLALVGESGSGKSTLARSLMLMQSCTHGSIEFAQKHIAQLSRKERRQYCRQVQMIFQDPYQSLNPRQTVRGILSEPLDVHGYRLASEKKESYFLALLTKVGLLPEHLDRFPHEFSGGQRQRIAIARALVLKPRLLICDEPTSALDVTVRHQILSLLHELQQEQGLTLIIITHDFAVVRSIADRVLVMQNGRIEEAGAVEDVMQSPQSAYTQALIAAIPKALVSQE